ELPAIRDLAAAIGVETGDLLGATVLHEALHRMVAVRAGEAASTHPVEQARRRLASDPAAPDVEGTLSAFREAFPAEPALPDPAAPLPTQSGARPAPGRSREGAELEELALLHVATTNPALAGVRPLFDVEELAATSDYARVVAALEPAAASPAARVRGAGRLDLPGLMELLRAPERAAPTSLAGQLRWIEHHWRAALTPELQRRLTLSLDLLAEEARARELRDHGAHFGGDGQAEAPELGGEGEERFSPDAAWMPEVVLIAKNTHVWLHQLSRDHGRPIERLDQVPDEELARLAARGINALWLIGLWERSRASREIKQRMGNPDAAASAYAVDRYAIAAELGGDEALDRLRERAATHGLRLASDMVPNHMGIDSEWVLDHPQRFVGLDAPPFPNYRFGGPDLSPDPRVGIWLEDGYWDHRDAAVVFKREDRASGQRRYLYHGNDGTSMPWNDTAQLDYLQAEVREAVIEVILGIARRFPIIRFDAAMTLARRHIQRLWYPAPGHGGAIPSRAEFGSLSPQAFRRRMPHEFWREVVDRVAAEVPDTLLLAEAFWLMEGYFVRTLGMHRVYNSAFMHMLRDEHNAEYRAVLRETLAFDPRVLERYVNFMSNPDERTAADQFGTQGKYAGVATLLATLPGLPLIGHGQLEGYRERYGMEFRRPQLDELPDEGLGWLHEARLYPLLRRRRQFARADGFRLFDVVRDEGGVAEDVFAYANVSGGDRSLVLYHNRWGDAAGRIRDSVPFAARDGGGRSLRRQALHEALRLSAAADTWYAVRDLVSGQEYLFEGAALARDGLWCALDAFGCQVLLDWRELHDHDGRWRRLADALGGRPAPDLALALAELERRTPLPEEPPTAPESDAGADDEDAAGAGDPLEGADRTDPDTAAKR
ncbi:MAG TPA: alpha-amylase family glycosyl hydrolase, partial [Candidatus Dormibacteraeota bacterium]|nr:alpha-amylase family glycosyl hydrolase [Candidatus Dormibacteraeota bacterium]